MRRVILASIVVLLPSLCSAHPASSQYVRDLRSDAPVERRHAAVALGRIGDKAAVGALIQSLKDPDARTRWEAAKALGRIKDARAAAPLIAALRDKDMNVRFYAAYALGEIKEPSSASALVAAMQDPAWGVKDQTAWALREINDPNLAGPLVAAVGRGKADPAQVVWILRRLGGEHAVHALGLMLESAKVDARLCAVKALGEIGGDRAVDTLIRALDDACPAVRIRAIAALLAAHDERAEQPLRDLAARETDPDVRAVVENALVKLLRHDALVAHWSFNDPKAKVAKDVTGRGSDGEIKGCTFVEGKIGHALEFTKGHYVELGRPPAVAIGQTPLTLCAWVKTDAKNGVVVARGGAWCGFSLYVKDGVAKFGIHRFKEDPTLIAAGKESVLGRWVHLAGVVKKHCIELYVDAKLAATVKTPGYIPGNAGQGMEIGFDTGDSPAEITDNFEGVIDEVKVFHAALSADEIAKQSRSPY